MGDKLRTNYTANDAARVKPETLRNLAPCQIDAMISAFHQESARLERKAHALRMSVESAVAPGGVATTEEIRQALQPGSRARREDPRLAERADKLNRTMNRIKNLSDWVGTKLFDEYDRRGGWNRVYLVTGGHAHRSTDCPTCNKGANPTQFAWMTDYSGMSEEEIVAAAGKRACTVCYPSAPVAQALPAPESSMLTPEEAKHAEHRSRKQAAKQEKERKRAAGVITTPWGGPLYTHPSPKRSLDLIKTARTAKARLNEAALDELILANTQESTESVWHLARAIAWKEADLPIGVSPNGDKVGEIVERARKKAKKELGK